MRYKVKRYWTMCDEVELDVASSEEAVLKAHDLPLPESGGDYVPDSMSVAPVAYDDEGAI